MDAPRSRRAIARLVRRKPVRQDEPGAPDPDAQLEWTPIRDVPPHFSARLDEAQHALARYLANANDRDLAIVGHQWDAVVDDPRFAEAPATFRADVLNRSVVAQQWCGARNGTTEWAPTALARLDAALRLAPTGEDRALFLHNVGMVQLLVYQLTGDEKALEAAIGALRDAIVAARDHPARRALAMSGTAAALSTRFRLGGAVGDIDEAVRLADAAVATAPAGSPRRARYQAILGEALAYRYDALGRIDDLERAIVSAGETHALALRGTLLRRRWEVSGDRRDLDKSIELLRTSIEHTAPGDLPALLTNLGNALLNRYDATLEIADLREAAAAHDRSVELSAAGDWQLASRHNNGGNSALSLYDETGDPQALDGALQHYERAVSLTSASAAELPSRYYNLGRARASAYRLRASETDAVAAADAYRGGCRTGLVTGLQWALGASEAWTRLAIERARWDEAVEASGYGIEAIDDLFRRQIARDEKEHWLARAASLPSLAAFARCAAGRPIEAVVTLERGRAFFLTEVLERDRARLDELLAHGREDLVRRYHDTSAVLRIFGG